MSEEYELRNLLGGRHISKTKSTFQKRNQCIKNNIDFILRFKKEKEAHEQKKQNNGNARRISAEISG